MLIAPQKPGILLYKLRYQEEIRSIQNVPELAEIETSEDELKLAKTLVGSMSTSLDKIELKDRYQGALREIIDSKIEGKEFVTYEEEEKPVVDIMAALKASIDGAKAQKKPMKKAGTKKPSTQKRKTVKAKAS
jgi:DNA end-binding protein Ku